MSVASEAAVMKFHGLLPFAQLRRDAFVEGWEAGEKHERERWRASIQAIFDAQYPPGILLALDALKVLMETEGI